MSTVPVTCLESKLGFFEDLSDFDHKFGWEKNEIFSTADILGNMLHHKTMTIGMDTYLLDFQHVKLSMVPNTPFICI